MERSVLQPDTKRTNVIFCEPNRSNQKGACENNHKYIRYILPKETNFDNLSQFQINRMINHINSYRRKALCGKAPYDISQIVLPEDFFLLLYTKENECKRAPRLCNRSARNSSIFFTFSINCNTLITKPLPS